MNIVDRLRHTEEETATIGQELVYLQVPVNPDGPEAANEIERLREILQMWVKFWEADGEDNIFEPLLAEEAMEATREALGIE